MNFLKIAKIDPNRTWSQVEFDEFVRQYARRAHEGHLLDDLQIREYELGFFKPPLPRWFTKSRKKRKAIIFLEKGVPENVIYALAKGINLRCEQISQPKFVFQSFFEPKLSGTKWSDFSGKLHKKSLTENKGLIEEVRIYITLDKHNCSASFRTGTIVFPWGNYRLEHDSAKVNPEQIHKVGLHLANHLLGMFFHCEEIQNVEGFDSRESLHCSARSEGERFEKLCPKCETFLRIWWDEIKQIQKERCE
jgi:hypothetical protein